AARKVGGAGGNGRRSQLYKISRKTALLYRCGRYFAGFLLCHEMV
ncbi:MAG: hypothetical protein AVDCRST_MAG93-2621, partial [uncultured Chloroflexia bacterium]